MAPDPRPLKRVRLSPHHYRKQTRALLERTRFCECGCGRRAESVHHALGGTRRDDLPENWLCIANLCHAAFTDKRRVWDAARKVYIDPLEVARGLRERMETERPEVLAHILARKGVDYLDRTYPRRIASRQ